MKMKLAALAACLGCSLGTFGPLAAAASAQTTSGLTTTCASSNCLVQTTTGTANGHSYNLTTTLNRFVNQHGKLLANVTTTGTVDGNAITPVTQNVPITSASHDPCTILDLTLGPLHLDLLGLVIDLNQVHLTITGQTGPGNLLGNLLCGLANALNGSGGAGGLANILNQLLAGLGL